MSEAGQTEMTDQVGSSMLLTYMPLQLFFHVLCLCIAE